jgi:hypothetical protein
VPDSTRGARLIRPNGGAAERLGTRHPDRLETWTVEELLLRSCNYRSMLRVREFGTIHPGVVVTHDRPLAETRGGSAIIDGREEGSSKVALGA